MERDEMLKLWDDSWVEGNWVPSWQDSLADLTAIEASAVPLVGTHTIWQEVVHVIFWRNATLNHMARMPRFTDEYILENEFRSPAVQDDTAWQITLDDLKTSHFAMRSAILKEDADVSRIPHHIYHDAYHLGRITLLRSAMGHAPKF